VVAILESAAVLQKSRKIRLCNTPTEIRVLSQTAQLPIFLVWPGASQFFLIDRAVPQLISFEPQLRPDSVGKIFHGARKRLEHANID
jgi:hypothetical protein